MVLYRERLNDEKRVLSRWNSVSRGQDENAFAISKCEHFSTWRSIHCEREMGPFRKIDRRCSPRYFRFLSLFTLPHATPPFLSSLSIDPWNHRKCERISHPHFFFLFLSFLREGRAKKKCQACNDRESWTRLESVSPPNGRQPMSNSSLRNRLSRFLRPPLTLPLFLSLSLSPPPPLSNEQLRRNWINLDGEKFREAEQPAKTLFRVALQWGHGFVLKGWIFVFPIPNGYRSFREIGHSYPDLVRRRRGKERPGAGLLKFFIVALFPFGQEARLRKTPKASISRKLGRARLEKVARSETAVGENESREKGREKAREEGRTVEKMARDDAFQPSSNRGRNHSKSGRFQRQVSAMGQSS